MQKVIHATVAQLSDKNKIRFTEKLRLDGSERRTKVGKSFEEESNGVAEGRQVATSRQGRMAPYV